MNIKSHNHWVKEIRKYVGDKTDEEIIKLSLSYTLQSLRRICDKDIDESIFEYSSGEIVSFFMLHSY